MNRSAWRAATAILLPPPRLSGTLSR
jgi:hypothetical protein